MKFLLLTTLLICSSCSIKKSNPEKSSKSIKDLEISESSNADSDGDLILDNEEIKQGTNPQVADLPEVKSEFLGDLKVKLMFSDETQVTIDQDSIESGSEKSFSDGYYLIDELTKKSAAKIGRFSGTSFANTDNLDFNWFSYPLLEKDYLLKKEYEVNEKIKNNKVVGSEIQFSLKLELSPSMNFTEIKDLVLNFYYYNDSKKKYDLFYSETTGKSLIRGSREEFTISIKDAPLDLVQNQIFKNEKYLILEVKDFYIPKHEIRYSQLLNSVKAKSIPVYTRSPERESVKYVSIIENNSFTDILFKLYPNQFEFEENRLKKLFQFESNLPSFTDLNELRNEKSSGNWFIMTNNIPDDTLKHKFKKNDSIAISYIFGSELASQKENENFNFVNDIKVTEKYKTVSLGEINNNTSLDLIIYIKNLHESKLNSIESTFKKEFKTRGNLRWGIYANYVINKFSEFEVQLNSNLKIEDVVDYFSFVSGNVEIDLKSFLKNNQVQLKTDEVGTYIKLKLTDFSLFDDQLISDLKLKISPLDFKLNGEGVVIKDIKTRNYKEDSARRYALLAIAREHKALISSTNKEWNYIKDSIDWGKDLKGFTPKIGERRSSYRGISATILSKKITNFN